MYVGQAESQKNTSVGNVSYKLGIRMHLTKDYKHKLLAVLQKSSVIHNPVELYIKH